MNKQNPDSKPSSLLPGAELPSSPKAAAAADVKCAIEYHSHPEEMSFDELTDIDNL